MVKEYQTFPPHCGIYFTDTTHHEPAAKFDPSKTTLPSPCAVCITGGGRGLGEAMAVGYAKAGASDIILTSRTSQELSEAAAKVKEVSPAVRVSTVVCDVTVESDVQNLAAEIKQKHGRLDVLINNAGHLDAGWQPITEGPADDWKRVFDVNVFGVYLVTRQLIPLLLRSENGLRVVVGVSSMSSHFAVSSIAMGMSKFALNRFIEYLADTYRDDSLVAFSLHPGGVKTAMSQSSRVPPGLAAMCIDSPDLSAAMAVWLTKERPTWLSGRYVASNWDVDQLKSKEDEIVAGDKLKFRMVV